MDNILILDFTKQSKTKQNNAEYKKSRQGGLNTFEAIDWNLDWGSVSTSSDIDAHRGNREEEGRTLRTPSKDFENDCASMILDSFETCAKTFDILW